MAVAAVAAGCQKAEIEDSGSATGEIFRIEAGIPETKTLFTPPTKVSWQADDCLAVVTNSGAPVRFTKSAEGNWFESDGFIPSEDVEYTYHALYPYSASVAYADGIMTGVEIPQTALQTGLGSTEHIDGALFGSAEASGTQSPSVNMRHLTTLLKIEVSNSYDEAVTLNSITVSTDAEGRRLSGIFDIDIETGALSIHPGAESSASASVSLETENAILEAGSSATFYLSANEFFVPADASLTVTVNGSKGVVTDVKHHAETLEFKAGTVNSTTVVYENAGLGRNEVTVTVNEDAESFNGIATGSQINVTGKAVAELDNISSLTYSLISRDGTRGEEQVADIEADGTFSITVDAAETLGGIAVRAEAEDGNSGETVVNTHVGYKYYVLEAQAAMGSYVQAANTIFFDSVNGKVYDYIAASEHQATVDVAFGGFNSAGGGYYRTVRLERLVAASLNSTSASDIDGYCPKTDWTDPYEAPLAVWAEFDTDSDDADRLSKFEEATVSEFNGDFESIVYSTSVGKNDVKNHSTVAQTIAVLKTASSAEPENIMVFENTAGKNVLVTFDAMQTEDETAGICNSSIFTFRAKVEL